MAYTKLGWVNDRAPALNQTNLNHMDQGIYDAHQELAEYEDIFTGDVSESVQNWLDEHPEATTTVQDGAITIAKLNGNLRGKLSQVYLTADDMVNDESLAVGDIARVITTVPYSVTNWMDVGGVDYIITDVLDPVNLSYNLANGLYANIIIDSALARPELLPSNGDTAVSIMANIAHTYDKYSTTTEPEESSMFTYGYPTNWHGSGSVAPDPETGKYKINCSAFVMNLIYGTPFERSRYQNNSENFLNNAMFDNHEPVEMYRTGRISSGQLAEYLLKKGYCFKPDSDLSNLQSGDILFMNMDESVADSRFQHITHCAIFAYWNNNNYFTVWEVGNVPSVHLRGVDTTAYKIILVARLPFSNSNGLTYENLVIDTQASATYEKSGSVVTQTYKLKRSLKPYIQYTAVAHITQSNDISDQWPAIMRKVDGSNVLVARYASASHQATEKPYNDVYVIPFVVDSYTSEIILTANALNSGIERAYTVANFAIYEGLVTNADAVSFGINNENSANNIVVPTVNEIEPTVGSAYSSYGGCYYYKVGVLVNVHIGLSGLTANTSAVVAQLPEGYRPRKDIFGIGSNAQSFSMTNGCKIRITPTGNIHILSTDTYANADITFIAAN